MKSKLNLSIIALIIASLCAVLLHCPAAQAGKPQPSPEGKQTPIAANRLGSEIDKRYGSGAAGPVKTAGGYKLTAKMQALEAEVTAAGLTVISVAKDEGCGSFSIVPVAVNGVKAGRGAASLAEGAVVLNRGVLAERFSASTDGIRQDFIIPKAPAPDTSELVLDLAVHGATVSRHRHDSNTALLTLASGRKLSYGKLNVTDAAGKDLPARISVPAQAGSNTLNIIVAARNANYPITIDPTITDADWYVMNPGIPGTNGSIHALAIDSSGNLYAGSSTVAGGVLATGIAKWNGSAWSALGSGINGTAEALAVDNAGNLYAGGRFITAGGVTANYIAKWDGSAWSALGSGIDGDDSSNSYISVHALAVDSSGNLYAAGRFLSAGGVPADNIAKWNGSAWSSLGGISGDYFQTYVYALAVDSAGNLYAGGRFKTAGSVSANCIAKWNGSAWSALSSGMSGTDGTMYAFTSVKALAVDSSGSLYAGGSFSAAGSVSANCIAKWNGSAWSALSSGVNKKVNALAVDSSGTLYAGGDFTTASNGSDNITANHIASWNGSAWSALGWGTRGVYSNVYALAVGGSSTLYAGGYFKIIGDAGVGNVAAWNGSAWSALGSGMNDRVMALAVDSAGALYAGGRLTTTVNRRVNHIAKWNGSAWSALASGLDGWVYALAIDSSGNLYAGGDFTTALNGSDNITVNRIAKWNGSEWSSLGSGMNDRVMALAVDSAGNLYAGGYFAFAGGVPAKHIAKWDGSAWSAVGTGFNFIEGNYYVSSLAIDSAGTLYAGGQFTTVGGVPAKHIAKWDGSAWSALGSGISPGNEYQDKVLALAVDSAGNLYAGGWFTYAGGVSANYIAKWDGAAWSSLGSGMDNDVDSLAVDSAGNLYAGGFFTRAGWEQANHIAKWNGSAWSRLGNGIGREYSNVYALVLDSSGNLFAGGTFTHAGGKLSPYIARCALPGNETTTTTVFPGCPAQKVLGPENPQLDSLRAFRDDKLARSTLGRRLISMYYTHAASINSALERSPALRAAARKVLAVIAPLAESKE